VRCRSAISASTQRNYVHFIARLTRHYQRRPDQFSQQEVEDFLLHLMNDRGYRNSSARSAISALRFIRRFLLHVLPRGFVRIRHFGFLANHSTAIALSRCRELLEAPEPEAVVLRPALDRAEHLGIDVRRCPCCRRGHMAWVADLSPAATTSPARASPSVLRRAS
jgi:hypothetical protein